MHPVPIEIPRTLFLKTFGRRKGQRSQLELTVDQAVSFCIFQEVFEEDGSKKINLLMTIPLEDIKEVRKIDKCHKKTDEDLLDTDLILFHGMEFNLKTVEFKILDKNKRRDDTMEKGLNDLISKAFQFEYAKRVNIWIQREYHFLTSGSEGMDLKRLKAFTDRAFIKISTADLEKIEKSTMKKGFILHTDFEKFAKRLLHSPKVYLDACGKSLANVPFVAPSGYVMKDRIEATTSHSLHRKRSKLMMMKSAESVGFNEIGDYQLCPLPEEEMEQKMCYRLSVTPQEKINSLSSPALDVGNDLDRFIMDNPLAFENELHEVFSMRNSIWNPEMLAIASDECMSHPLAHYWIASSHNTYLTGNQYSSASSVECYARSLRQGCRCIEIDVWDGPKKSPIVTHGMTLTSKINLEDVLLTVKKHAFATSPYPVIISIENHCSVNQQKVMAKMLLKVFDKMLFYCNKKGNEDEPLPTLDKLKHRILLKCRKLPQTTEHHQGGQAEDLSERFLCATLRTGKLYRCSSSQGKKIMLWEQFFFILTNDRLMYLGIPNEIDKPMQSRFAIDKEEILEDGELHWNEMWFYGKLEGGRDKDQAIVTEFGVEGGFLVRNRTSDFVSNDYCICVLWEGQALRIAITSTKSAAGTLYYHIISKPQESDKFPSVYSLVSNYKRVPISLSDGRGGLLTEAAICEEIEKAHEMEEWFYPEIDRKMTERVLSGIHVHGAFIARYSSERKGGRFVISFRVENFIKHCRIKEQGRFLLVSAKRFSSLSSLVDFYMEKEIDRHCFYKNATLKPVTRDMFEFSLAQDSEKLEKVYTQVGYLTSTIKTEKSSARVTHSYTSYDTDFLSLEVGDEIQNVVKFEDGWWRGDLHIPGEQKLFCANFVEEIEVLDISPFGNLEKGSIEIGKAKYEKCKEGTNIPYRLIITIKKDKMVTVTHLGVNSEREAKEWAKDINYVFKKNSVTSKAVKKHKIAKEFSDLIVLSCSNVPVVPAVAERKKSDCKMSSKTKNADGNKKSVGTRLGRMTSFSEIKGDRVFNSDPKSFIVRHQNVLSRVYPKSTRMDSSNFNPIRFWNVGCQIVALNYQTPSKPMQWNRGKFRQNEGCGYVLKPKFMWAFDNPADLNSYLDQNRIVPKRITLKIIAGRHFTKLEKGTISPFVEIEIAGVDSDCRKYKTNTICDNGLNPYWNQEFVIPVTNPDLALIQFSVFDEDTFGDGQLLGESTIPMTCIRTGCRSIQLYNKFGEEVYSTLLVNLSIELEA